MKKQRKEKPPLTKKGFEALLTKAAQPIRQGKLSQKAEPQPDREEAETSESQHSDD